MIKEFFSKTKIFFVGSISDQKALIALHPFYDSESNTLRWWDTNHERLIEIKNLIGIEANVLSLQTVDNKQYRFIPMTLQIYNNLVKNQLPNPIEFGNEEEMIESFEKTMI